MSIPFSEQAMTLVCRFSTIESSVKNANKPHTFCQTYKTTSLTLRSFVNE